MSNPPRPDFEQFRKMLAGEKPDRPVIFEHYIDWCHVNHALGNRRVDPDAPPWGWMLNSLRGLAALGYDCGGVGDYWAKFLRFPLPERAHDKSVGQFSGGIIHDEASMEAYAWPEPDLAWAKTCLDGLAREMPTGMKVILGSRGIYDLLAELVGFEMLCLMVCDQPELFAELCRRIGERQVKLVEGCAGHSVLGGVEICDDWGFKTGTFLSPDDLRRWVLPWHRKIVETAHAAGQVAILHACGDVRAVMDDVIAIGYDGKHSYEDAICPVEKMYDEYGGRIAVLGGLDVDFLARSTPERVYRRSRELLEQTGGRHYALGSGNSVTPDVSWDNYMAMLRAAWEG